MKSHYISVAVHPSFPRSDLSSTLCGKQKRQDLESEVATLFLFNFLSQSFVGNWKITPELHLHNVTLCSGCWMELDSGRIQVNYSTQSFCVFHRRLYNVLRKTE